MLAGMKMPSVKVHASAPRGLCSDFRRFAQEFRMATEKNFRSWRVEILAF